jgi:hypothetical protein
MISRGVPNDDLRNAGWKKSDLCSRRGVYKFYLEFVVLYYFDEFHASYSFPPDRLHDVEWHDETGVLFNDAVGC